MDFLKVELENNIPPEKYKLLLEYIKNNETNINNNYILEDKYDNNPYLKSKELNTNKKFNINNNTIKVGGDVISKYNNTSGKNNNSNE